MNHNINKNILRYLKNITQFILFSNLWICVIATLMAWHTFYTFQLNMPVLLSVFIFFSTAFSYCTHWYLTILNKHYCNHKSIRIIWTIKNKRILLIGGFISLLICDIIIFNTSFIGYFIPPFILVFFYTTPKIPIKFFIYFRKFCIAKTLYLSVAWTYVVAIIPIYIYHDKIQVEHWHYVIDRFLFIYLICAIFDYKDRENEKGLKNLMSFLNPKKMNYLVLIVVLLYVVNNIFLYRVLPHHNTLILCSLLIPFGFILITIKNSLNSKSDYWYYGFLDGLFALPSLIIIFIQMINLFF